MCQITDFLLLCGQNPGVGGGIHPPLSNGNPTIYPALIFPNIKSCSCRAVIWFKGRVRVWVKGKIRVRVRVWLSIRRCCQSNTCQQSTCCSLSVNFVFKMG